MASVLGGSCRYAPVEYRNTNCGQCGKRFHCPKKSSYRRTGGSNYLWFCSWSCLRKWDEEHNQKDKNARSAIAFDIWEKRRKERERLTPSPVKRCEEDIEKIQGKIKSYQERMLRAEPGSQEMHRSRLGFLRWRREEAKKKAELEALLKGEKDETDQDGHVCV